MFIYPPPNDKGNSSYTKLSFFDRVLHFIITHTIHPHSSNYSTITQEDLWFLFHIKYNCRIDVGKFIMDDMLHTIQGGIKNLFYGMLINEIINYFKVDNCCDLPKNHSLFNFIDEHSIKKLGFELKNNTWVKKRLINNSVFNDKRNEGEPSTYPNGLSSAQLSAPMSTTFNVRQAFTRLISFVETMDSRLTARMIVIEA
ncbi:Uncharacterized protein TCM_039758 [Theobroma cacao]|uniref:Uncharacterized protein n=1 Tax=Theobroma cacao TaxID=3641 RepID=A0A061GRS5_THECC|nr:Uncharacterized protein TCM_039758 [Theobroma cacao]